MFNKENDIASRARQLLEQDDSGETSGQDWKQEFFWLTKNYEKLLKDSEKITRIGDVNLKKLMAAKEQIDQHKDMLEDLNMELLKAHAAKDRIYSIIAHDLKNPLHFLLFSSDMVGNESGKIEDESLRRFVEKVFKTSQSMYELLENLLQWSRSQYDGEIVWQPRLFDLQRVIKDIFDYFAPHAETKSIRLMTTVSADIRAYADENMIHSVIRNLVSNSIKFTQPGGEVQVACKVQGEYAVVSVSDTGVGIPKEKRDDLFKLGETFSTTGTGKETGTGLGLVLCKDFVEKNGGTISYNSSPDSGSCFQFTVPLKEKDD